MAWSEGHGRLGVIEGILGDEKHALSTMLRENGLVDAWDGPKGDYSPTAFYHIVLLFLAMRHG